MRKIRQSINSLVGRMTRRDWDPETVANYVGSVRDVHLTHAEESSLRSRAASGASVSGMLLSWLDEGLIDGALVCKTVVTDGLARGQFYIATNRDEILESRGSLYVAVSFARGALPLIDAFDGNLAVVGLPCHVDVLRRRMARDPEVNAKVKCIIGLICGHSSQTNLVDGVTKRLENQASGKLTDYHFRHGHWRGKLSAGFHDGKQMERPFSEFSLYQNLYFWSEKKCFQCNDHFGYRADLSVGDVWSMNLRNNPIKHTCVLVRTAAGQQFYDKAVTAGAIKQERLALKEVLDGQARTAPFHYNISARIEAAARYGLTLKDTVHDEVHWNHRIVAEMAMFNWAWSQHPKYRKLIFKIPRPLLKAYLALFKLLESF